MGLDWFFTSPQVYYLTLPILAWIYLNVGWRFAELKLSAAKNHNTFRPDFICHIYWPLSALWTIRSNAHSVNNDRADDIWLYKFLNMLLYIPLIIFNLLVILILWGIWLLTWGRFKPY